MIPTHKPTQHIHIDLLAMLLHKVACSVNRACISALPSGEVAGPATAGVATDKDVCRPFQLRSTICRVDVGTNIKNLRGCIGYNQLCLTRDCTAANCAIRPGADTRCKNRPGIGILPRSSVVNRKVSAAGSICRGKSNTVI